MAAMRSSGQPAKILPTPAPPGSTLGIIAPASNITKDALEAGCATLTRLGYKPFYFDSILERDLYFAGDHQRRAWELHEMYKREEIKAVVCARGGYGCNHLLPLLDLELIRLNPKRLIGYSDVTTLLTWITEQADVVTFHGPMVAKDYAELWESKLTDRDGLTAIALQHDSWSVEQCSLNAQPRPGSATGVLYGGCLSMLAASLGTPYEIQTAGTILFMEDINTKPYQIDRMLMQLKLAGKFRDVRGIVFGEMLGCSQPGGQDYSLEEVVIRILGDLEIPIGFGLMSGHVSHTGSNRTLAIGTQVSLRVVTDSITISPA